MKEKIILISADIEMSKLISNIRKNVVELKGETEASCHRGMSQARFLSCLQMQYHTISMVQ